MNKLLNEDRLLSSVSHRMPRIFCMCHWQRFLPFLLSHDFFAFQNFKRDKDESRAMSSGELHCNLQSFFFKKKAGGLSLNLTWRNSFSPALTITQLPTSFKSRDELLLFAWLYIRSVVSRPELKCACTYTPASKNNELLTLMKREISEGLQNWLPCP